ncbi:hypothetical protein LZ30DRAFT_148691 [Colletotrichum cereale]|nr:hypothetical protein LZ30DRAFT_148691 [Colletotrichum cereale]
MSHAPLQTPTTVRTCRLVNSTGGFLLCLWPTSERLRAGFDLCSRQPVPIKQLEGVSLWRLNPSVSRSLGLSQAFPQTLAPCAVFTRTVGSGCMDLPALYFPDEGSLRGYVGACHSHAALAALVDGQHGTRSQPTTEREAVSRLAGVCVAACVYNTLPRRGSPSGLSSPLCNHGRRPAHPPRKYLEGGRHMRKPHWKIFISC